MRLVTSSAFDFELNFEFPVYQIIECPYDSKNIQLLNENFNIFVACLQCPVIQCEKNIQLTVEE